MVNSVFKSAFIGFLIGVAAVGTFWFFFGRSDIKRVRQDLNTVHESYESVQRISDQLSIDVAGLTRDIALINTTSGESWNRGIDISERLENINGDFGFVLVKVDELESINIGFIRLGRNFGDVAFDLRRLREKNGND